MAKIRAGKITHLQHNETGYRINGRIWVAKDGDLYLGWGRIILLERIDELGSISAAARSMKLGYGNAWLWIDSMNRLAPAPLVEKVTGGRKGGCSRLTQEGRKAVIQYKELREKFLEFIGLVS
ncbi:MAG: winged helix-turn-helix domain-containing protein [Candidatus Humimicrobiaceae bacterium]